MSGPIVRKYGFPNFEEIFGKRELEHGAEEQTTTASDAAKASSPSKSSDKPAQTPPQSPQAKA